MNVFNIEKALKLKTERNWDTLYVVIDANGTIIRPYHHCIEFYTECIEVLQWFSNRKDFKLILWTSSHIDEIEKILQLAEKYGIYFDAVNSNNYEPLSTKNANFTQKFYFNILIDDKSGFVPETDWFLIKNELIRLEEWNKKI
jgi:hypothetical protein